MSNPQHSPLGLKKSIGSYGVFKARNSGKGFCLGCKQMKKAPAKRTADWRCEECEGCKKAN